MQNIVIWFKAFVAEMLPPKQKPGLNLIISCSELPIYGDKGVESLIRNKGVTGGFSTMTLHGSTFGYNKKNDVTHEIIKSHIVSGDYDKIIVLEHEDCQCYKENFPEFLPEVLHQIQLGNLMKFTDEAKLHKTGEVIGLVLNKDGVIEDIEERIDHITGEYEHIKKRPVQKLPAVWCV